MNQAKLTELSGDAKAHYVKTLATALKRARLNRQYPDGRKTADHITLMGPQGHHGLYDELEIDLRSGLPSYREWVRVSTDKHTLCGEHYEERTLEELERRASNDPNSIWGKKLLQHHYRAQLLKKKTVDIDNLEIHLMRVDPNERTAQFRATMDKLSVSGTFSRTTIELTQKNDRWNSKEIRLEGEHVEHTDSFRTLIYSLSNSGAEMLFHRLEGDDSITVQQVVRGTIGPIFLPGAEAPEQLEPLVSRTGAVIASFSLDTASRDQQEDRHNDPFSAHLARHSDALPQEVLDTARNRHGYRVFRDRKFVTDADAADKLDKICRDLGTRNIVYKL